MALSFLILAYIYNLDLDFFLMMSQKNLCTFSCILHQTC